jgi:hypothetical protein
LIEQIGGDAELATLVAKLLENDREALRVQKQLLQLWEEAPLAHSIEKSIALFGQAHR